MAVSGLGLNHAPESQVWSGAIFVGIVVFDYKVFCCNVNL